MYKLLVYPFNMEDNCITKYCNMLRGYELTSLVCLEGAYENGRDAGEFDEVETGLIITDDYNIEIDKCDVVLLLDKNFNELKDTYIKRINTAVAKNKIVMTNKKIYDFCLEEFSCNKNIRILDNIQETGLNYFTYDNSMIQPDIPVITVMSIGESCNKFEAQLDLRKKFHDKGYKVLQFGTKDYCDLFDFKKIPSFLMSKDISIDKKIYMFNYYINREALKDDYDVIIIGVAGGLLPVNRYVTNYFGEIPLIVSSALNIDINVLCSYHNDEIKVENLYECRNFCKGRLGCFTDYYYMSDRQFRISYEHDIEYFILDRKNCVNNIPVINDETLKFCHVLDTDVKDSLLDSLVEELEGNVALV
ncbi:TIGR04066 family peptide maturation system protein [Clostridium sp. BNL1100]|uniref:TIGR04066 family peptide maturation system protein n=1 Tax=Clostridium sp. BNL1100 TaxID=755731 RepID=UPI00024A735C|nr:TIGR04066 family peptide maturation system protein [Clostridium sp. BNL1100]AEY64646.1 peptide maturation system protein, TIGR04066 family [Clostridium sp. BNL1100]